MFFYPLYYDIISLTSLKIAQVFHLLLGFAENQRILKKIQNSVRITESLDNRDSDNRGPTVLKLRKWPIFRSFTILFSQMGLPKRVIVWSNCFFEGLNFTNDQHP